MPCVEKSAIIQVRMLVQRTYMLDTLKISKRFIEAGMTKKEAEAVAEVLKDREDVHFERLATKEDIEHLKEYIEYLREYMKIASILMTLGFAALGFLMAYLSSH